MFFEILQQPNVQLPNQMNSHTNLKPNAQMTTLGLLHLANFRSFDRMKMNTVKEEEIEMEGVEGVVYNLSHPSCKKMLEDLEEHGYLKHKWFAYLPLKVKEGPSYDATGKKIRKPKENKKIYMLSNPSDVILNNTLIKALYELLKEGPCTFQELEKFYIENKDKFRRTDGTLYKGKGSSTVRGALEANRFFKMREPKRKDDTPMWEISDNALANAFFRDQKNTIKAHKKKYRLPIKDEKKKDIKKK